LADYKTGWDYSTSVEEVMYALNDLVVSGKVIYLGISDTPAWIVSKANEFARAHHLRPFVVYQGKWSAADRDAERDIIPMCKMENMGLCPWGSLGGGNFKTQAQRDSGEGRKMAPATEKQLKLSEILQGIAKRKGVPLTSIALAYVMHKTPYVFPIVGGRSIKHLQENIEALGLELSDGDMDEIEDAIPFDIGIPNNFAARGKIADRSGAIGGGDLWISQFFGHFDFVEQPRPIQNGLHKADIENKG
jgi:aryl-alcohol dehydrogenase-like predicted oxidoreductase